MAVIKELKLTQRYANGQIKSINKQLKLDCYAGRFQIKQIKRIDNIRWNGLKNHLWYCPTFIIAFIDKENTEHYVEKEYKWSDVSGLCDFYTLYDDLTEFIGASDFWDKWNTNQEYRDTHWFSGATLQIVVAQYGKEWKTPTQIKAKGGD